MADTTSKLNQIDDGSRSSKKDVVEDELPPTQPSDAEHSLIHDQLTAPMGSYKMTYARRQVGNDDEDSYSESDADNDQKGEASDDGDGGDDEKSPRLSNYASDEAVSFVESCESFDRFTDSSDEAESDEENNAKAKGGNSAGGICRRRESNSDSDTDDESEEENEKACNTTSKESNCSDKATTSGGDGNASSKMNNLTEATKKKSSEKLVGIWDDDGVKRRRSTTPARKLWSDYVYKADDNRSRGHMRAGSRFTSSFTDKRQPEQVDQFWNPNQSNHFPPPLGLGLGRGLVPNNNMHHESNNMRPPGPSRNWQQQRRPNNPYCHYQQQQKYFGMPRGSYASVVQKGPANAGRTDSRNTNPTRQPSRSRQGNENGFSQQSHNTRQNQQQSQQQRPAGPGPQKQQQSYNHGTVTAAQILQQQRMQQSKMQQANRQQDHQRQGNQANQQTWQPPKGPHVRPLMIGTQQVYVIHPSWNRRPIAEEDPAIVRADPPVPQPYMMLPGGIPLALPMAMRNVFGGNPAGQTKTSGSGGMYGADLNLRAMPAY